MFSINIVPSYNGEALLADVPADPGPVLEFDWAIFYAAAAAIDQTAPAFEQPLADVEPPGWMIPDDEDFESLPPVKDQLGWEGKVVAVKKEVIPLGKKEKAPGKPRKTKGESDEALKARVAAWMKNGPTLGHKKRKAAVMEREDEDEEATEP